MKLTDPLAQISPPVLGRTWGFRFSVADVFILAVLGGASVALSHLDSHLSWLAVIVAGHFFLFCNVFHIA